MIPSERGGYWPPLDFIPRFLYDKVDLVSSVYQLTCSASEVLYGPAENLRQELMLKNADFDDLFHRKHGELNSRTQQIMTQIKAAYGLSDDVWRRKVLMIRSLLFGAVFLFDSGEFAYSEETLEDLRCIIDREFQIHQDPNTQPVAQRHGLSLRYGIIRR